MDRTGRPALVLTHEDGEAHGSGRSVAGFHLLDALTAAHTGDGGDPLFLRFGGHAHAAGFALASDRVALLRARMERFAAACPPPLAPVDFQCDAELALKDLDAAFLAAYERLAPFGNGNQEPVFLARNLRLTQPLRVFKERHLAMQLAGDEGTPSWRATAWSRRVSWTDRARNEGWGPTSRFDLAFRLSRNWHPDFGGWELTVQEVVLRPPAPATEPHDF